MRKSPERADRLRLLVLLTSLAVLGGILFGQDAAPPAATDPESQLRLTCAGMGFQNGYLDGYELGAGDFRYHARSEIQNNPIYDKAERGFNEKWVYRVVYQEAFRTGFLKGYDDGYQQKENVVVSRFAQLEEAIRASAAPAGKKDLSPAGGPVVLPAGTRLLLKLDDLLTTKMNQRGDLFTAVTTRDFFVGNNLAIPEGTLLQGSVGQVQRPGRVSGRAELTLRFDRLKFKDGSEVPVSATLTGVGEDRGQVVNQEGTYQEGGTEGKDAAVVAGGAGTGTVIGAIAGGGKGAGLGAVIGGLVGLAGVLSTRGEDIELTKGTLLEIMLDQDLKLGGGSPSPANTPGGDH